MKKVTIIIGSPRKQATYRAAQEFVTSLKAYTEIEHEYVFLKDYRLESCRGCALCCNKGEEYCPLQDDRDILLEKMQSSDGVIVATPNYVFQLPALLKNFLDRLSFLCHRPLYFGKAYTAIVTQGIYGGNSILKYLGMMGENLGFHVSKGCCLTALDPRTVNEQQKISQQIQKASARFYKELVRPTPPTPTFIRLILFRLSRTTIRMIQDEQFRDYQYYKAKGWFESDYYYDTSIGIIKKLVGRWIERLARRMAQRRATEELYKERITL